MKESAVLDSRPPRASATRPGPAPPDDQPGAVQTLTEHVLGRRMSAARELLEHRLAGGLSIEHLLCDYLAPSARQLGALWDADHITFTDVTVGVGRLQDLQRSLDDHLAPTVFLQEPTRALLATVPGEQHAFGVSMTAALLHRRGWDVSGVPSNRAEDLLAAARSGWYEVIGLSLGCERHLETMGPLVDRLRDASMNEQVRIAIGGRFAMNEVDRVRAQLRAPAAVTLVDGVDALAELVERPKDAP